MTTHTLRLACHVCNQTVTISFDADVLYGSVVAGDMGCAEITLMGAEWQEHLATHDTDQYMRALRKRLHQLETNNAGAVARFDATTGEQYKED